MLVKRFGPYVLLAIAFLLYAVWLAYPIALVTADIGRHLMNGEVIAKTPELFGKLVSTNFYSYTYPDAPAINHHWLSGVFFRFMLQLGGWTGMHLQYILISLLALGFSFDSARRLGGPWIAALATIALLPLIGERTEIRPEGFAYLIASVMVWVVVLVQEKKFPVHALWALPVLQIFWTNIHASFPVGIVIIGAFTAQIVLDRDLKMKFWLSILGACILATLLNPNGIFGAIEPLKIFRDPGYAVVENQSLFFLEKWGMKKASFWFLKGWALLLLVASGLIISRKSWKPVLPWLIIVFLVTVLAFSAARHITLLGFLLVPAVAGLCTAFREEAHRVITIGILSMVALVSLGWHAYALGNRWIVIGLAPGSNGAANFIKQHEISGPFFSDFDIAGYLIYHFFPDEKVFISNVPEAHPPEFFREVYIPMQQDTKIWAQQMERHGFNAIVYFYGERTAWAQEFLKSRVRDPLWAPVYVDDSVLIFVRRLPKNQEVIHQFEIPASSFTFGS